VEETKLVRANECTFLRIFDQWAQI